MGNDQEPSIELMIYEDLLDEVGLTPEAFAKVTDQEPPLFNKPEPEVDLRAKLIQAKIEVAAQELHATKFASMPRARASRPPPKPYISPDIRHHAARTEIDLRETTFDPDAEQVVLFQKPPAQKPDAQKAPPKFVVIFSSFLKRLIP